MQSRMPDSPSSIASRVDRANAAAPRNATDALRESEARQAFLLELADTLRSLADSDKIQAEATRVLGVHLRADRVAYFEIQGADYVVRRDYTQGVQSIAGRYPVESFGAHIPALYRSGQTAISNEVATETFLPPSERAAHLGIQIAAFIGVPLIKDGEFVGGLTVHMGRPRTWTRGEIALVEETAERTWAAVERARAEEALRISERETKRARDFAEATLRTSPVPLVVLESDLRVVTANEAFYQTFGTQPGVTVGQLFFELGNGQWNSSELRKLLEHILPRKTSFKNFEVAHDFAGLGRRDLLLNARRMENEAGTPERIVLVIEDITERKRAEELLRESEARYRTLFESMDEGFCVIEFLDGPLGPLSDYVHVRANPAYERHSGIANVAGQRVRDMVPGEADGWVELYRKVLVTGTPIRFERELVATGRYLELAASRIEPASRRQVAVLFQDITARKKAELELRRSRDRFDIVKESTQVGFWFCDLPFDKLDWDHRVKEHFWLPPDVDVTIGHFYERLHPTDREPTRRAIEASIAQRTPYEIDYRTVAPDGRVKWIRAIGRGFYNEQGQPIRFDGVTLDVTERRRAEEQLRDSEAQLAAATVAGSVGTWIWDLPKNVLTANPALARAFGMDAEQVQRGLPAEAYIGAILPEDQPAVVQAIEKSMSPQSDGIYLVEYRTRDADGRVRWLFSRGRVEFDAAGKPVRMPGALTDITERKEAEAALRAAKERAEAASRSKDDFLAALSHELRTPLTPVLMAAAARKDDSRLPEDVRQDLAMIERNIALEARLIEDLLDLTAVSHGKLKLRLERSDLRALVQRALEMVAADSAAKEITVDCQFHAEKIELTGDLTRLHQVVWNLLRNAVKFTPAGGRVSIGTYERTDAKGRPCLILEVSDTGVGIEAAELSKIFQPFDQGAHAGNHRFGGLGLGLAIAHAVVAAHGGTIRAESAGVGRGATFIVELPQTTGEAPRTEPARPSARPLAKIAPLRLLLVEDHENTLQTLARLLRQDGHQVTAANTIADAQAAGAHGTFDVVISDLGLPDGSGTELMEHLRSAHGLRGIALSGYGMEEDIVRSRASGFVAHLVKPVAIADLRRVLTEISGTSR